jgi:subfamily B ATP-binding cassette protein MsbA
MLGKAVELLLDRGFHPAIHFSLWLIPCILLAIFVLRGLGTFCAAYFNNWVVSRALSDLRARLFDRLLDMPAGRFHLEKSGMIINTMVSEARQVVDMVDSVFLSLLRDVLAVAGLLGALLWLNWRLTLVAVVIVPLTAVIVRATTTRLRQLNREDQRVTAEMTQVVKEATLGYQVIRLFSGKRYERERFASRSNALRSFAQKMTVAFAATTPVTQIATSLALSLVIVLALQSNMTAGQFTNFITMMLLLLNPLKAVAEVNGPLQRGMAAADTVFEFLDAPVEVDMGTIEMGSCRGHLKFDNVTFSYPGTDRAALSQINLDILPGSRVAIVGASGGGKSTLVALLSRFYDPVHGQILLDGVPYPEIRMGSLRDQLALVSQNVVLFDDTIAANVAYGVAEIDEVRLATAIKTAYLDEVVAGLPNGLDTNIGDNGLRLSGGQRQRVAIARAIYKNAPILILDEATAALDNESEREVKNALEALTSGRTSIIIAHRLSTVERADVIVVVERGRIVETGTHKDLLQAGGAYAALYYAQFAEKDQEGHLAVE